MKFETTITIEKRKSFEVEDGTYYISVEDDNYDNPNHYKVTVNGDRCTWTKVYNGYETSRVIKEEDHIRLPYDVECYFAVDENGQRKRKGTMTNEEEFNSELDKALKFIKV